MPMSHNLDSDPCVSENLIPGPLFTFRQTPTAGLGALSLCVIPKGTIILTLPGPYASVVMRKWRKGVCGWCFKWRYAAAVLEATSTLTCEASATLKANLLKPVESLQRGGKRDRNSHFLPGLWCCSPSCLASWIRNFELWEGEEGQWVSSILEGFEKALGASTRREREKRPTESFGKDRSCMVNETVSQVVESKTISTDEPTDVLDFLSKDMADVDISAAEITPEFLDHVWDEVENLLKPPSGQKRWARAKGEGKPVESQHVSISKSTISSSSISDDVDMQETLPLPDLDPDTQHSAPLSPIGELHKTQKFRNRHPSPIPRLNELELDTARFVLDGMIRKVAEQFSASPPPYSKGHSKTQEITLDSKVPPRCVPDLSKNNMSDSGLWKDFMLLQDNELEYTRSKPHMLVAGVKIYAFLKGMVWDLSGQRWRRQTEQAGRQEGEGERKRRRALDMLSSDLESFEVVRAILGRDPGNVFGIWEEGEGEESEMYGWGAYVFGSFFNHDCIPNLQKRRVGRSVEFYTLRDVKEGDELSIAYVDVEGEDGEREKRNTRLKEHWFFSCRCESCINGDLSLDALAGS